VIGDEGGGYWIGREVLRSVSRALDGRGPATTLLEAVRHPSTGCDGHRRSATGEEALRAVYRDRWSREQIAGLSVAAAGHAEAGDPVARGIIERAAAELGGLVAAVARRLEGYRDPLPVYAIGGVMEAGPVVLDPLERWLSAVWPAARFSKPLGSPLEGALLLAQAETTG
jgi:N-acetylglucosamine kinase-like BadF-type ATPase